ncbi:MAG: metallophosphoesterase family protein [Armatimonadota bacterium]|nr:metallophosphoesterase family protein [Armatimonadota bacterium]MDR5702478.1 metallophosphoesterase family protein [Armatimonadota bacterium]
MRIAIFSDVHGNLPALEAVLEDIQRLGDVDTILIAGDLAFGGPHAAECVNRIRGGNFGVIRGNTDEWIVQGWARMQMATPLVQWTRKYLSEEHIRYLEGLPFSHKISLRGDDLVLVHATPWDIEASLLPDASEEEAKRAVEAASCKVLVYGHIHRAYQRVVGDRLLVNVGSVGFPLDGDPRASYGVFTYSQNGWEVELRRVEYDREQVAQAILASDHPAKEVFVRRVRHGQP